MPKTKKYIKTKRSKKIKKTRRRMKAGKPKHECCICGKSMSDGLMPRSCYMKHGEHSHRICQDCWWDPNTGFANETSTHGCPGCLKGMEITNNNKPKKPLLTINENGKNITVIDSD